MRDVLASLLCLALAGCGAGQSVQVHAGAPTAGEQRLPHNVSLPVPANSQGVANGLVAAGTASGLLVADAVGAETFHPGVDSIDTVMSTGQVSALAQRDDHSLLVAGENGLFILSGDSLLASPLNQKLQPATYTSASAFGTGASEELWLLSAQGLVSVTAQNLERLGLDKIGAPALVVAAGAGEGLVMAGGTLWSVTLADHQASKLLSGLGNAYGAARDASGTVWIGTDAGLVARTSKHALVRYTLAAKGDQRVCGVFAAGPDLYAGTATSLLHVHGSTVEAIGTVQKPSEACPIAVDSQGSIYVVDSRGLLRFPPPAPVSFAGQIEPLFQQHCANCHAGGMQGAPKIDFTDYATAQQYAGLIAKRVQDSQAPMPPSTVEVLPPDEIALIVNWVQGGTAP